MREVSKLERKAFCGLLYKPWFPSPQFFSSEIELHKIIMEYKQARQELEEKHQTLALDLGLERGNLE